jgi:hypothetical protein
MKEITPTAKERVMVRLLTVLACVAVYGGGLWAGGPAQPRFQGDSLPTPPRQSAPWTPPKTRLSSRLIAATRTLFEQGLADPRGCEYREIKTIQGDSDEQTAEGVVKSHGWLLPADPARPERFAVCWDGLVYPVLAVGPAADLRADAAKAVTESETRSLRLCMLLRLGKGRLAEECFEQVAAGTDRDELCDPYLLLAKEWTGSLLARAESAHTRGDDKLALLTARTLVRVWEAVELEATDLDLPREKEKAEADGSSSEEIPLYLPELLPVRAILADQERRAAERRQKRDAPIRFNDVIGFGDARGFWKQVETKLGRRLNSTERVTLVIRWFEDASEHERWLADLLRPYRDEAVEPLLDCLQNDTRLCRGGEANEMAHKVLCELLESRFEVYVDVNRILSESRSALVRRIRAHWQKVRNLSAADGWYEILRDDSESPDRWTLAVCNALRGPYGSDAKETSARREAMRKKRNPSMTELLLKRARALAERGLMDQASGMALALAEWEPAAALPVLKQQTARWREVLRDEDPEGTHRVRWVPSGFVPHTLARVKLKDASALADYMQFFRELSPQGNCYYQWDIFQPLLQCPDDPAVVAGTEWFFNDPASAWNANSSSLHFQSMLGRNPLLALPAFRKRVLYSLADTRVIGSAKVESHDRISMSGAGLSSSTETFAGDPLCPPPGSSVEVRQCDECASELAEIGGMPRLELYWPKTCRDQAIAECRRLLQQYGHLLAGGDHTGTWPQRFTFPALDHPATQEDARSGRAIFSLEGQGPVHCCKLPKRPAEARWVTFRGEPFLVHQHDEVKGADVACIAYHQTGAIWQAEEVQVAGTWRRFYGFAGAGRMAKVPAEEIQFEVRGEPWNDVFNIEFSSYRTALGLVNRSGLPQPVPHFRAADDPRPAPPGATIVDFRLYRFVGGPLDSDEAPPEFPATEGGKDRRWREVPRGPEARLKIGPLPAELQPMETVDLFRVKLDADYPKLAPGSYWDVATVVMTSGKSQNKKVLRLIGQGYSIRGDAGQR